MGSVGEAYAILKGRKSGSSEAAEGLLSGMPPGERSQRNRTESRFRGARRRKPYRLGERKKLK